MALGGDAGSEVLYKSICDRRWSFVRQVHGVRVLEIDEPQPSPHDADALLTTALQTPLCVLGADCALVGLASDRIVAAAHVGWRGLVEGVIDATARAMHARGAEEIRAVLSACIHPECYSFSAEGVDAVSAIFGDEVRAISSQGDVALDLPAAVKLALRRADVELAFDLDSCTACGGRWFSHRAHQDRARQALVIWREANGA